MDPNISIILVSSKMGPSRVLFQRLDILVSSISGPKISFRNLGELQNGPKSSIVSEIEYLGELLFWAQDMFQIMKLGELQWDPNIVSEILVSSKMGPRCIPVIKSWRTQKWAHGKGCFRD